MLSGVSAFLVCEYRVLSFRYCTVCIYRDVCTQLHVCNLVLVCDSGDYEVVNGHSICCSSGT